MFTFRQTAAGRFVQGYLVATVLTTVATFTFLYYSTVPAIEKEAQDQVSHDLDTISHRYRTEGIEGAAEQIEQFLADDGNRDTVYLLTHASNLLSEATEGSLSEFAESSLSESAEGSLLPETALTVGNLENWPPELEPNGHWQLLTLKRLRDREPVLIGARGILLADGYRLLAGRDMRARAVFRRALTQALSAALVLTVAITLGGGYLLSRFLLQRVRSIAATADDIMRGDLSRRMRRTSDYDEFDQLAGALNAMLARIDDLMTSTRSVTDSVAHDFRRPLTRLKTRLEVTLHRPHSEAELRAAVTDALEEIDDLLHTLNALLEIVRAEGKVSSSPMTAVDLTTLVRNIGELYQPLAEDHGLTLITNADEHLRTHGHPALLAQAVSNLVDNAIKYSPTGTTIAITASLDNGAPLITVADHGPGIPENKRDEVLKRFVRLDDARSTPGAGLGLSLVAAVAKQHDASLTLGDNHPGLRADIRFTHRHSR